METNVIEVVQPAADAAPKNDFFGMLMFCAIIFAVLYFFMIMPNKRRMKEYKDMLAGLKVGGKILCAGGIYGVIKKIDGEKIHVEIAKGVVIEIPKNAVVNVE
ncbi:MAG: preprotein translocase subunit YajC [Rickettsiales bacterium]|jgi:preprotein translocase subunit YajC|nr:preprotein translocase subunit YajC [Rickettsiales bacterium]